MFYKWFLNSQVSHLASKLRCVLMLVFTLLISTEMLERITETLKYIKGYLMDRGSVITYGFHRLLVMIHLKWENKMK